MKVLYLDCFSGISGNMFLGGLVALGLPEAELRSMLASLKVEGFNLEVEAVQKKGIAATHLDVRLHHHEHEHHHEHDHHHHHADDVFTSWGTETPKKYEKAELDSILKKLSESEDYGKVLRSKGMLPCTDGTWMYFDLVPEEYEIREGSADFTGRICVIGSELKEDALKELFEV